MHSNTPQIERNWAMWRSAVVNQRTIAGIAREHGMSRTRADQIVSKCARMLYATVAIGSRAYAEQVTEALRGCEIVWDQAEHPEARIITPDGCAIFVTKSYQNPRTCWRGG